MTAKQFLFYFLSSKFGVLLETEFKGISGRKFRFDYAVPSMYLAVEFEGIISTKSRHTSVTGYTNDSTKYNLAQLAGWTVLRYTQLNYQSVVQDVERFLQLKNKGAA